MSEQPPPPPPPPPPSYTPPPPQMPPGGPSSGYTPPPAGQPYMYPAPGPRTEPLAIVSLILGILAFPGICCWGILAIALGIPGFILGRMAIKKVRASGGTLGGAGIAQAGWICSVVAGSLGALYLLFIIGTFVFSIIVGSSGAFATPTP